jgi:hypothetical protein
MIKVIILSIIICSAVHDQCQIPYDKNINFDNWADCMREGTNDTLTLYTVMGDEYINTNKIFIKFSCREKMIKPEEKT